MSILQYKYKAHRLVNTLFYVIVFIIGFLLGFTCNKIDFSKLLSQVLMIDNVSAEELNIEFSNLEYIPNSSNYNDEKFIFSVLNEFNKNTNYNYSLKDYPYVYAYKINNQFEYYFYKFDEVSQDVNGFTNITFNDVLKITFVPSSSYYDYSFIEWTSTYIKSIDNVNSPNIINSSLGSTITKILDFSVYTVDYKLNDGSIFEDENHLDFKKYCWENFDELVFSITIDDSYDGSFKIYYDGQQDGETYVESGFYVFDDISKLKRGTRSKSLVVGDYKYNASTWLSGLTFNHLEDITTEFELLHTEEKLGLRYSAIIDALGNYDIVRQDSYYYDNLDKLKNASYVDFTYYYNVIDDYKYDVFHLEEKKEKFCIYVPNIFVVTTLQLNELGGFVGDIPIHNDSDDSFIDITETTGQLHFNQLFSIINKFINSIKDTVIFINDFIYSFIMSLHPLIQMFIFTIITLLVVKLIIGMVVK